VVEDIYNSLGQTEPRASPLALLGNINYPVSTKESLCLNFAEGWPSQVCLRLHSRLPMRSGTPTPPRPESYAPLATPWWDNAEQAVIKLIEKNKLDFHYRRN
jgi:hypothetical protein